MSKSITIKTEDQQRPVMLRVWQLVTEMIQSGPVTVGITRPSRSAEQNRKFHAMIRDIHRSAFRGNTFEGVKALMVAEFAEEMRQMGTPLKYQDQVIYSHRLKEWITVRPSTSGFKKDEAAAFVEFLYMMGEELGVKWSEPALAVYAEYREAQQVVIEGRKAA